MSMSTLPSVAFGEGRRPEAATRVVLPAFDGPLALLLSLIEARQLDVLTVPLGALADAYLDALATLDEDRMGHVSAFVAVASQLILIKSRAMLPRRAAEGPVGADRRGARPRGRAAGPPDPVPRVPRRRHAAARRRRGPARPVPPRADAAHAAGVAGARPPAAEPLSPALLVLALDGLARVAPPPAPPPETIRRTVTLTSRAAIIREALRGAPVVVLQDLLRGVRDRVVVAVTFLALLELMKRREIVVEQAEPWGPIIARRTTRRRARRVGRPSSVDEDDAARRDRWSRSRDRAGEYRGPDEAAAPDEAPAVRSRTPSRRCRRASSPRPQLEALLFVAEKPLSRREIGLLAGVDRATVDARLGDLEVALAGRGIRLILSGEHVELTTAPEAGALIARYVGADAVRLSPGGPRDARDRRLSPAGDPRHDRARPGRRLRLHGPGPAAPAADRGAGPVRRPGPPVPVRDRVRVPRALRAHLAGGAADPRPRRRDAARGRGRGGGRRPPTTAAAPR